MRKPLHSAHQRVCCLSGPVSLVLLASIPLCGAFGQSMAGMRQEEYLERKRAIHEQMTGERLDEDGKSVCAFGETKSDEPSTKRVQTRAATAPLTVSNVRMKQRNDSKLVDITYDITGGSGNRCRVTIEICDDKTCIVVKTLEAVTPGKNLSYVWDAGSDWPNRFSKNVNAKVTAEEMDIPVGWADIYVQWDSFGGRDLDICGYWADKVNIKVGWSWGSGTSNAPYFSKWYGDNVNKGPEHIVVKAEGRGISSRDYRIHFNYYGELGSPCKARVVVSNNGVTLSETQSTGKHLYSCANMDDPCVTITFDEYGTPIAIRKGR